MLILAIVFVKTTLNFLIFNAILSWIMSLSTVCKKAKKNFKQLLEIVYGFLFFFTYFKKVLILTYLFQSALQFSKLIIFSILKTL